MVNNIYAKAYKEVLEIIRYFPQEEYNKIPKEKIDYYINNMDKNYEFTINPEISLTEQNISKETSAIIVTIFRDYFATEEQKGKLEELIALEEKKSEKEKREKYNPNDIFKNTTKEASTGILKNNLPIEVKKRNFFEKMIDYIKNLFKHKQKK